ncbi:pancreatic secretory granule membrane major glycoprotein GP2 isoform X1 [Syngnathoides biaculeatus]|uniref:pancreatic secretory granule membrane major glycoprotein GP2 isoform X1 n=1 Tax=Syngnathoides biaculeatus TaxID=300417 RepID=UPI002ADE02BF|nr:pancreatic secretory granule membrane major glycoprotein GP2 isoform X1 [Syngnathoides biaculeatus]XP_061700966.1 pancreatic secretory granule membrane major glycoprotein GP2 isoform X1 [Syngnathoides biaculeatus]
MASLLHAWLLLTLTVVSFQEEMNETVICTTDHMEVVIPSAFFLHKVPPVYVWDLHLNDPDCRGVEVGDDYVFSIKSNLSRCGSVMTSDATHILFINTIHSNHSDVITRNYINITFVCRYPVSYMVQQPNGENMIRVDVRTIMLNTEDGNFSVSMLLYKDEAFADQWTAVPSLTLDDHVFVKVFMIPTHLMLRMERCWATPTRDPYSHIQYTFIRDSCPVLTDRRTLSVLKNGRGAEAAFGIQMFKFVGSSYTNVFLHCNVRICHGALGLCQPRSRTARPKTSRRGRGVTSRFPTRCRTVRSDDDPTTARAPLSVDSLRWRLLSSGGSWWSCCCSRGSWGDCGFVPDASTRRRGRLSSLCPTCSTSPKLPRESARF